MRRINRDAAHEEFVKSLTTGDGAIFRDIWRLLLFAAAYGVAKNQRLTLGKVESNKAMPETYFSSPGWRGFLYLLGFVEGGSSDHLRNDEEQQNRLITTFEEYANFGLTEMKKRVTSPSAALPEIIAILLEQEEEAAVDTDIADLI